MNDYLGEVLTGEGEGKQRAKVPTFAKMRANVTQMARPGNRPLSRFCPGFTNNWQSKQITPECQNHQHHQLNINVVLPNGGSQLHIYLKENVDT